MGFGPAPHVRHVAPPGPVPPFKKASKKVLSTPRICASFGVPGVTKLDLARLIPPAAALFRVPFLAALRLSEQHKYRETVLFFPSQGQTRHSYCTPCFRWAQFVGDKDLRIASSEAAGLHDYLQGHPEVTPWS